MPQWTDIGPADDYRNTPRKCVSLQHCHLIVFNVDQKLYAVRNSCPHAGLPLSDGDLNGKVLTCPFHGYAFNIEDGRNIDFPDDSPATTYPVRETDSGRVEVDVEPQGG